MYLIYSIRSPLLFLEYALRGGAVFEEASNQEGRGASFLVNMVDGIGHNHFGHINKIGHLMGLGGDGT